MKIADPVLRRAWRMAAIYRLCLRRSLSRDWALQKVRDIAPDGSRDYVVGLWFTDMARLQQRHRDKVAVQGLANQPHDGGWKLAA